MRIAIDAMGGDHAPEVNFLAAREIAAAQPDWEVLLVGTEEAFTLEKGLPANIQPVLCGSVMAMDENVENLLRKKDSSIWMATQLVKEGKADAIVSAGSTAAQMTAATLLLGRVKGVSRPAIGVMIPSRKGGRLLLDMGANADCTPEMLLQFAEMGAAYVRQLQEVAEPRVALLCNGTEAHKGNKLTQAAYALMEASGLNFLGNREGRDIAEGDYDVMVCDGMSGNIAVKSMEGAIKLLMTLLKEEMTSTFSRKIGAALVRKGFKSVKKNLDYQEYGGAPLLGVKGVSIVCHGSSKARAIVKAAEVAAKCVESALVEKLAGAVAPGETET